jgi:WD40-like Beta Propeller Repeat
VTDPAASDGPLGELDAAEPDAFVLGAFGTPTKIAIAADPVANEDDGTLSYSGLELVYARANGNDKDLFYATRATLADPFANPVQLAFSAAGTSEETPRFSADDLTLFYAKTNGANGLDIFKVTRPTAGSTAWGTPQLVAGVSSAATEKWFMPCSGNRYLVNVGGDIAEGTLGGGPPVVDANLSSAQTETGNFLTQDCLRVYFASTRPPGTNVNRLYRAQRATVGDAWSTPVVVDDFAALGGNQEDPFLATDERTFVFVSNIGGSKDLYISVR